MPKTTSVGNDTPENFASLSWEFLEAARFAHAGFGRKPKWPTYLLLFQAAESFLKAYLVAQGATIDYVKDKIGHHVDRALAEAKQKGLTMQADAIAEAEVIAMSKAYASRDFQYRSTGEWRVLYPCLFIAYVEALEQAVRRQVFAG